MSMLYIQNQITIRRELAPDIVSLTGDRLTGDWTQGDDSKQYAYSTAFGTKTEIAQYK